MSCELLKLRAQGFKDLGLAVPGMIDMKVSLALNLKP